MTARQKKELTRILTAAALFLLLFIAEHTGLVPAVFENRLLSVLVYLVPYLICGLSVLRKALSGIRNKQPFDESFLMTIATIGAFVTGEAGEAVAVMLFYQVGEFFQSLAVARSRRSISDLMDIAPDFACIRREDGSVETVDPDDVEVGDILVIRPGERIPVDATVLEGESLINTSALTGESVPRSVRPGEAVISGCINGSSLLVVRADACYDDSTVAKILEMVETASEKKSKTENFITRFARYYTPVVVFAALALALIPPLFTGNFLTWVYRACTFLVISCPCALVISVPLSFFGGIGAASRKGVLVKGSNYLELLAQIDTLVTDKTGTLTKGTFRVTSLAPAEGISEEDLLRTSALAERTSTHPIAVSICEAADALSAQEAASPAGSSGDSVSVLAENVSGRGVIARTDGHTVYVGNRAHLADQGIKAPDIPAGAATVVHVAKDGAYLGAVLISDEIKPEAKEAIAGLLHRGVRRVVMLTGDRKEAADAVASELGISQVRAGLLPQDKAQAVEELLAEQNGRTLAFAGDGINDAPVLARADVGIAMGSLGSDAAIEAADVVIMDDDLKHLPAAVDTAKKTVAISRQNIVFALAVKALVLILGALGAADMWAAVFADVGVAVLCILNAMRLMRR